MVRTTLLLCLGALLSISYAQLLETEEAGGEEEAVELFTTPRAKMAAATSDFGYNLFRALAGRDPKTNVFLQCSLSYPWVSTPQHSSPDRSEKWLYRALRYHTLQDPQLHNTLRDLLASLRAPGKGLSIAARVYLARRLRLKQEYFGVLEKQYGVRPKALMGGAKDVNEINDWVKQQTGGKVDRFMSKPLGRNSGVVPLGAAYFKGKDSLSAVQFSTLLPKVCSCLWGAVCNMLFVCVCVVKWMTRFSQSGVMEDFQLVGEAPARIPMMQQDNYPVKMGIDPDLGCTVSTDAVYSAVMLFPVVITFLTSQLSSLPQAVKLGSLNHKVVMEMAPEGTQYASSRPASTPLSYCVDHPFLFLVRDEASGALLFIGKVVNPRNLRIYSEGKKYLIPC
uniref:Serpin domain-containing protein n=1 Tax=Hucho hucho TaxID=62062 RepID=A0A4W5LJC3_9TELE